MQTRAHTAPTQLERRLGFWSVVAITIGVTIGSGIFRTPAAIATRVPDPMLMLAAWVLGGSITLCGALSFAELAAALPYTGGLYVYLRESWGRLAGFLFGWAQLVLIRASATGAISTVFSEYLLRSLGFDPTAHGHVTDTVAAAAIIGTAAANIRGVRLGAAIVGTSTTMKFGALALMVLASLALGGGAGGSMTHFTATGGPVEAGLFGLALISVLWAYDGFADASYVSGEVIDTGRALPRAIIGGTIAIVAIYVATNTAYLYVNPIERIAQSPLIAADTMATILGPVGVATVSVVVTISTFGALMSTMLTAPRTFFAMADDRLFFRRLASVHPRFRTPYVAIALAAALGVAFVFARTFEQLTDVFVLSIWPFYALAVAGLYQLRRTKPRLPRPYRVPGYPVVPAVFVGAGLYLVGNALVADPLLTTVPFIIILAGVPVYYFAFRGSDTTGHRGTEIQSQ
jgi:basic amino acid/polyamine antiporter, APA family